MVATTVATTTIDYRNELAFSATWRLDGNVVTVTPLRRLSKKDITAITVEGRRVLAFAAPGVAGAEVVVSPVPAA